MPYPRELPTNKHDLVGPDLHPAIGNGEEMLSENKFASTSKLFEQIEQGNPPHVTKIAAVYTYPDSPTVPGPLSRGLIIVGFADSSLSAVRKLTDDDFVPSCLHKCTVGVKLADASHASQLKERDVANSHRFAKLTRLLRKEEAVAILGRDKHDRFGILCPMDSEIPASSEYASEDFAAVCFVGNVQEVKEYLAGGGSSEQAEAPAPLWQPPSDDQNDATEAAAPLWQPPSDDQNGDAFGAGETSGGLWQPPSTDEPSSMGFGSGETEGFGSWEPPSTEGQSAGEKRKRSDSNGENGANGEFHADTGAAAADRFYSGLKRDLGTRADSRLFHMRSFNGWVKATQIQELQPKTLNEDNKRGQGPLRVLDLACGKGGDLGKWVLHNRGISNYVGIDVARGSLQDAALRARKMRNKLKRCTFTCADLGADVPGRPKTPNHKQLQKLLTWSLQSEYEYETADPQFEMIRGGGISTDDKFDVVSIQFAIHYMMSSRTRARRFFQTVSQLLEIGGNLIATTIDARVVVGHMMNLGADLHFDNGEESTGNDSNGLVVTAGDGACRIQFENEIVKRIFQSDGNGEEDLFGLQYTFTLVEGSDHAAGVGDAVNLPEWLTPIPALKSLASEAGLELEYAQNFHEFFATRQDPQEFPIAHNALYNMKVLDRHGSLSNDEWDVSRLYAAVKFRKVRESQIVLDDTSEEEEEEATEPTETQETAAPAPSAAVASKLLPMAMMKAKRAVGEEQWQSLSSEEKKRLTQIELDKMAKP